MTQPSSVPMAKADRRQLKKSTFVGRMLNRASRFRRMARMSKAFHVAVFRLSRGSVMGRWFGSPVLVLEVPGRKSSKLRRTPMTYRKLAESYVVVPINGGSTRMPAWWLNLSASGEATILVRGKRIRIRARQAEGDEERRLWNSYVEQAPVLEEFRAYAGRRIPVVVLEPVAREFR